MNRFEDSHAFGESAADDPLWEEFYRRAFPGFVSMAKNVRGNAGQFSGIDRWLCLSSGKVISVDEKKRSKDYGDILLEYVSNDRSNTPGWIAKDLAIDYLAYAFMTSRRCFLFPWPALRASWLRCGQSWIALAKAKRPGFSLVSAENPTYRTLSIAVRADLLVRSVSSSLVVSAPLAA